MARPTHRNDKFHRGFVPESQLGSATATDGYVLTATNTGTAAWESATAGSATGEILISDTPAGTPLVFADLIQNEAQNDLVYED